MKKIFLTVLFSLLSILFVACEDSPPIEQKKLIKIYSDMLIMQDSSSLAASDIKQRVFSLYNISEYDYESSIAYLKKEPERWQGFYDSVIVYLQKIKPVPAPTDVKTLQERSLSPEKKNL